MSATEQRPVAVVTGASAGVGRATAVALARRGFDVGLLARGEAGLAAAVAEVERSGARGLAVPLDIADFDAVEDAGRRVEAELGVVEVWVNNAMTTVFAPLTEIDAADFRRAVEVTLLGQVWGTRVALDLMRPRDHGSIVNVGSALAFVGIPLQSAYCASKFACRGFFESTRAELLHEGSGVTLSMVHLPAVNTPQFEWCKTVFARHPQPVPPIYQPEVAAEAIVTAALTGRPEKVLGSWNKLLVIGARAVPALASHFAARGAWEEQLADRPVQAGRPVNLYEPADGLDDHGSRGTFGGQAKGFLEPSFLVTLPKAARELVGASLAAAAERWRTSPWRRTVSSAAPAGGARLARTSGRRNMTARPAVEGLPEAGEERADDFGELPVPVQG